MRVFTSLLGSLIVLLALCFAIANRQDASISLWPFGVDIVAPIYLLTLGSLFFGILLGAIVTWVGLLPHRLAARRLHREIMSLHEKLNALQQSVTPTGSSLPLTPLAPRYFWNRRFWNHRP